jgi:cell division septation protein DedD
MIKKHRKSSNFVKPLVVLAIISLATIVYYSWPKPVPTAINYVGISSGTIDLSLTPSTLDITPNTESTLSLNIVAGANHVTGAQIEIVFDPDKLGVPTVTLGDFLPVNMESLKIEGGKITFAVAASPSSGGKTGSGVLATIRIKPDLVGITSLTFGQKTAVYATESADNLLKSASDASITISAALSSAEPSTAASIDKPAKPTGLRHNCFDGGNKITLRWDAVSGVDSYKLRLDQKDGDGDKSINGLKVTEGETTIIPDQKYSWWVHSTKDGVDSEEAKIDEIVCAKTVTTTVAADAPVPTSTPKSTPKPTVKATAKPSVKSSSKPSPSTTSTTTASIIPIESPRSIGSLNDIFKDADALETTAKSTTKPGFFQMLGLGWQAIFQQLAQIFK